MQFTIKDKKWILIVEDDQDMRESVVELLQQSLGEEVGIIQAKDGMEATHKINCQSFSCIVTDLEMPKKEGTAFLASVRGNMFNEQTPVVIVSGFPDPESVTKSFPFACFLSKPFQATELVEVVQNKMKIGKNGQGLSAGIFNDLVNTTMSFLENIFTDGSHYSGQPFVKQSGEEVAADMVSTVQIKSGKVATTFSIMINEESIKNIMERMNADSEKKAEDIQRAMAEIIMKHVMSKADVFKDKAFDVRSINYSKDSLTQKKGIVVPIGPESMQVRVFAATN